jgi:hypothetical protein
MITGTDHRARVASINVAIAREYAYAVAARPGPPGDRDLDDPETSERRRELPLAALRGVAHEVRRSIATSPSACPQRASRPGEVLRINQNLPPAT